MDVDTVSGRIIKNRHSSRSWRVVTDFVRYFGVRYTTSSFKELSLAVVRGDFIAYRSNPRAKKWNHIGFVADTSPRLKHSDVSGDYYDFRIIQHTSDYDAWVSSDKCGWDVNILGRHRSAQFAILN